MNNIVATPRVAKVTDALSVSVPEIYAVVMEHVIVMPAVVLLKTVIASPVANIAFGITILPPLPTPTNLPTSEVASVYEPVLSDPDCATVEFVLAFENAEFAYEEADAASVDEVFALVNPELA
jgi:hypothetical protein